MKKREFWQALAMVLFCLAIIAVGLGLSYLMITDLDWLPPLVEQILRIILALFILGTVGVIAGSLLSLNPAHRENGSLVVALGGTLAVVMIFVAFLVIFLATPFLWGISALAGVIFLIETLVTVKRVCLGQKLNQGESRP